MYLGNVVELAESEELYRNTRHPNTEALLSAVPTTDPEHKSNGLSWKGMCPARLTRNPVVSFIRAADLRDIFVNNRTLDGENFFRIIG
jgi:ABC-type oligopeptide transport system ATPase subunit